MLIKFGVPWKKRLWYCGPQVRTPLSPCLHPVDPSTWTPAYPACPGAERGAGKWPLRHTHEIISSNLSEPPPSQLSLFSALLSPLQVPRKCIFPVSWVGPMLMKCRAEFSYLGGRKTPAYSRAAPTAALGACPRSHRAEYQYVIIWT